MYTVVPKQEIVEHRPRPGEPALEIIDHRDQQPKDISGKKKKQTKVTYDTLRSQRDELLQKELKYKKRIEDLEKESHELVKTYETTYDENVKLKRILDNGPSATKVKQLARDKKEQKGMIDQLKGENEVLAEQLAKLEREVHAEKLKANEKEWEVQLAKVQKKRETEDSIPTEGPFVAGHIAKRKRMLLHEEDGDKEVDSYDLEVDSLEKETQVLLNKVKLLKREKEQIDYATLMGKGAVTKNKSIAKAINDKLNRDLNKFVMRLQMLKMKQNAARTYFSVITDETNPTIQLKEAGIKSEPTSPKPVPGNNGKSWKRQTNNVSRRSSTVNENNVTPNATFRRHTTSSETGSLVRGANEKVKETSAINKPPSVKNGNTPRKSKVTETGTNSPLQPKTSQTTWNQQFINDPGETKVTENDKQSAQIWKRVQAKKLADSRKQSITSTVSGIITSRGSNKTNANENTATTKNTANETNTKSQNGKSSPIHISNGISDQNKNKSSKPTYKTSKQERESMGRYSHGPEPVGGKLNSNDTVPDANQKKTKRNSVGFVAENKTRFKNHAFKSTNEDKPDPPGHNHGYVYRINGPDDGYSLIKLHNHVKKIDSTDRANPVPINFKTRRSFDMREGRSIIGNSGIRNDVFYRRINDDDPYFGL